MSSPQQALPTLPAWKEAHLALQQDRELRRTLADLPRILPNPEPSALAASLTRASFAPPQPSSQLHRESSLYQLGSREWLEAIMKENAAKEARRKLGISDIVPAAPVFGVQQQSLGLGAAGYQFSQTLTGMLSGVVDANCLWRMAHDQIPPQIQLQRMLTWERMHASSMSWETRMQLRTEINKLQKFMRHHGFDLPPAPALPNPNFK